MLQTSHLHHTPRSFAIERERSTVEPPAATFEVPLSSRFRGQASPHGLNMSRNTAEGHLGTGLPLRGSLSQVCTHGYTHGCARVAKGSVVTQEISNNYESNLHHSNDSKIAVSRKKYRYTCPCPFFFLFLVSGASPFFSPLLQHARRDQKRRFTSVHAGPTSCNLLSVSLILPFPVFAFYSPVF